MKNASAAVAVAQAKALLGVAELVQAAQAQRHGSARLKALRYMLESGRPRRHALAASLAELQVFTKPELNFTGFTKEVQTELCLNYRCLSCQIRSLRARASRAADWPMSDKFDRFGTESGKTRWLTMCVTRGAMQREKFWMEVKRQVDATCVCRTHFAGNLSTGATAGSETAVDSAVSALRNDCNSSLISSCHSCLQQRRRSCEVLRLQAARAVGSLAAGRPDHCQTWLYPEPLISATTGTPPPLIATCQLAPP